MFAAKSKTNRPTQQIRSGHPARVALQIPQAAGAHLVILAVSYNPGILITRIEALQRLGHVVVPTSSLETCRKAIQDSRYHLLLIGATVPGIDRTILANLSRAAHPESKIVSVERAGELTLPVADLRVRAGDERALVLAVSSVVSGESESDVEERRR